MWFDILKTLLDLSNQKDKIKQEKRERLCKVLDRMANVVQHVIEDLEKDIYPSGSCVAMEELADNILSIVSGIMTKEDAEKLQTQLFMASRLELEYAMRKSKNTIPTLYETKGKLEALSIIYSI